MMRFIYNKNECVARPSSDAYFTGAGLTNGFVCVCVYVSVHCSWSLSSATVMDLKLFFSLPLLFTAVN